MFLLIIFQRIPFRIYSVISIHLMFLLIQTNWWYAQTFLYFNTSHVSINLRLLPETGILERISIHLMFLLIIQIHLKGVFPLFISIHLMFLLIGVSSNGILMIMHFNTSHVSINRTQQQSKEVWSNFNTSHVSINQRAEDALQN